MNYDKALDVCETPSLHRGARLLSKRLVELLRIPEYPGYILQLEGIPLFNQDTCLPLTAGEIFKSQTTGKYEGKYAKASDKVYKICGKLEASNEEQALGTVYSANEGVPNSFHSNNAVPIFSYLGERVPFEKR